MKFSAVTLLCRGPQDISFAIAEPHCSEGFVFALFRVTRLVLADRDATIAVTSRAGAPISTGVRPGIQAILRIERVRVDGIVGRTFQSGVGAIGIIGDSEQMRLLQTRN